MVATYSEQAAPDARHSGGFFSRVRRRLDGFWQRVSEGLEIRVLWTQFFTEARDSYSLYQREVDWDAIE